MVSLPLSALSWLLSAFVPLCPSTHGHEPFVGLVAPAMAWEQLGQGVIWASPGPLFSLCPFVGVQTSFYHLSQQVTPSIILSSKHVFPSTLSYLLSALERLDCR